MKKLLKWLAPSVAAASLFFYAGLSVASVELSTPSIAVYTFNANCEDCAQALDLQSRRVSATLTLKNYLPTSGATVNYGNFLSFSYSGSNLFDPFTITPDNYVSVLNFPGDVFPGDGPGQSRNFSVAGAVGDSLIYFTSFQSGDWSLGNLVSCGEDIYCAPNDFGGSHTYSLTSFTPGTNPNAVPEPGSLPLMGAALLAIGVARRRRA